jgi:DNA-directed RNA polymerase specialized sigma24 family protein
MPAHADPPDLITHLPRLRRYARAPVEGDLADPGERLRAWLFTLMHNVYLNQVRQRLTLYVCRAPPTGVAPAGTLVAFQHARATDQDGATSPGVQPGVERSSRNGLWLANECV